MSAELPPRPEPPRRLGDTLHAWLAWFGVARLLVSAVCVVAVAAGVAWLVRTPPPATEAGLPFAPRPSASSTPTLPAPVTTPSPTTEPARGPVLVHVAGAVTRPGVYELDPGARVHAAIEAAGGPADEADLDGLNLASDVADGMRIYVPTHGEVDPSSVPSGAPSASDEPAAEGEAPPTGPIDLNSATATQLETLPGIGPATAAAIIDDRERHGPFATVGDLERVPGIGPAKLAAIADGVTV